MTSPTLYADARLLIDMADNELARDRIWPLPFLHLDGANERKDDVELIVWAGESRLLDDDDRCRGGWVEGVVSLLRALEVGREVRSEDREWSSDGL